MARYDYRREYKDMSVDQLKEHLEYQRERLYKYIFSGSVQDDCVRRISYLKSKIEKMEGQTC